MVGALIWVWGVSAAGYFLVTLAWVQQNLEKIIWAMILIPGLVIIFGAWKAGRRKSASLEEPA